MLVIKLGQVGGGTGMKTGLVIILAPTAPSGPMTSKVSDCGGNGLLDRFVDRV